MQGVHAAQAHAHARMHAYTHRHTTTKAHTNVCTHFFAAGVEGQAAHPRTQHLLPHRSTRTEQRWARSLRAGSGAAPSWGAPNAAATALAPLAVPTGLWALTIREPLWKWPPRLPALIGSARCAGASLHCVCTCVYVCEILGTLDGNV